MMIGVIAKSGSDSIRKMVYAGDESRCLDLIDKFKTDNPTLTVELHRETDSDWTTEFLDVVTVPETLSQAQSNALRAGGISALSARSESGILLRAFADVVRDEINTLRAQHSLAPRTLAQLRNAIEARINAGTVDS